MKFADVAVLVFALAQAAPTFAQDLKTVQLEQDVRELQREVQQQSRRIEALERELSQAKTNGPILNSRNGATLPRSASDASSQWLNMTSWEKLKAGASEQEVIGALGPPTAVRRSDDGRQTLLYSLEIASGGFLSGQVALRDHRVVDIQKPALK